MTRLWIPIGIICQFCGANIANPPPLLPEWKLGTIRPLHIIWYPFIANLLNSKHANLHDLYVLIFDLKHDQELILPNYNANHNIYKERSLL